MAADVHGAGVGDHAEQGVTAGLVDLGSARGTRALSEATKDQVSDVPWVDEDGHISEQEEAEIYRCYGLSASGGQGTGYDSTTTTGTTDRTAGYGSAEGYHTSGPNTDDAVTRS
ncbi:MAG TPA: hypothetical protein VI110_00675 [Lapillicoccus sp.]